MAKKIYYNAKIYTSESENSFANMMIIDGEKINWIGQKENYEEKKLKNDEYEEIDLEGKNVIPAFIDPHMHAIYLARDASKIACIPPNVKSIKDLQERIKEKKKELNKGEWIEGWGYDEGKLKEGRSPNRYDLDEV
ncbi:MAG: amidohydrolase family protein, partial [Bacillota bacterium]